MQNWTKHEWAWVPGLVLLLLTGCATSRYLKRGDQALSRHSPIQARQYFELALARKPDLSRDPLFMEKLRISRRDARIVQGDSARAREEWLAAITFYQQSLSYEPGYQPALNAIEQTRATGLKIVYDGALQAADRNDVKTARLDLSTALQLVPNDPLSTRAQLSLDAPEDGLNTKSLQDYRAAVVATAAKRWHEAEGKYLTVKSVAPWHLPARMGITTAREEIDHADQIAHRAQAMFDRKAIPQTRKILAELKTVYPTHPDFLRILTAVESVEADVASLLREAENLIKQKKYDQSIALCQQALNLYPAYPAARKMRETAERKAADQCIAQAGGYFAQKKYSLAAKAYQGALTYPFRNQDARKGLALISKDIAMESNRAQKPASALLWALHAETYQPGIISADAMAKLRWQIMSRYPLNMSVSITAIDRFSGEAAQLEERLEPGMTRMTDAPDGYLVAIDVIDAGAETSQIRVEELSQPFDVAMEVDNPVWYQLRDNIHRQGIYYDRSKRLYDDRCRTVAQYEKSAGPRNPKQINKLKNIRQLARDADRDMRVQADRLGDLQRRFRHTHPRVTVMKRHLWNYRRETTRRTVTMRVRMTIYDPGNRAAANPQLFESVQVAEDALVVNPNPEVGVNPDPLELPAVTDMRTAALADVVKQMETVFRPVILADYFADLNARAGTANDDETKSACQLALWMMQKQYGAPEAGATYRDLMNSLRYPK